MFLAGLYFIAFSKNLNGIFPILLGLILIIFNKPWGRFNYEHFSIWKGLMPHRSSFLILLEQIWYVIGGIGFITIGVLILTGIWE